MSFPIPVFEPVLHRGGPSVRIVVVLVALCSALATSGPVVAQSTGAVKVAVIDVERILLESDRGKAALGEIESLRAEKQQQGEAMQKEISELRQRLAQGRLSLSEDKIADLEKELEEETIALRRFQDDANRELNKKRDQILKTIEDSIFPVINRIGEEGDYTMIFNKFSSGLVYAEEAIDITGQVIERYNESASGQTDAQ